MTYPGTILKTFFGELFIPIILFGNSSTSQDNGDEIDTSIFEQTFFEK